MPIAMVTQTNGTIEVLCKQSRK